MSDEVARAQGVLGAGLTRETAATPRAGVVREHGIATPCGRCRRPQAR
jgi:hypothetical protein